ERNLTTLNGSAHVDPVGPRGARRLRYGTSPHWDRGPTVRTGIRTDVDLRHPARILRRHLHDRGLARTSNQVTIRASRRAHRRRGNSHVRGPYAGPARTLAVPRRARTKGRRRRGGWSRSGATARHRVGVHSIAQASFRTHGRVG